MNVFHVHDDENGNLYRCTNTGCDVTKNRMKKYYLLRHKEEELLEKYEKAIKLHDSIAKRRQSIGSNSSSPVQNSPPGTNGEVQQYHHHAVIDKRLSSIVNYDNLCTPKHRRFSLPTKEYSTVKYRKKPVSTPRPISCLDETILEEGSLLLSKPLSKSSDALTNLRLFTTPIPSPQSPTSASGKKITSKFSLENLNSSSMENSISSLETLSTINSMENLTSNSMENLTSRSKGPLPSSRALCKSLRLRKLSSSADNIHHQVYNTRQSLQEMTRLLTMSVDNIHKISIKPFQQSGNLYHATKRHPSSVENIYSLTSDSPSLTRRTTRSQQQQQQQHEDQKQRDLQQQQQQQQRLMDAKQKHNNRQHLLNSLNKDIKKANRFLRTLRTRSMPILEDLQIDFEKPIDVTRPPRLQRIKSLRSISVDMVI